MKKTLSGIYHVNVRPADFQVFYWAVSCNACADSVFEKIHSCSLLPCVWVCHRWVWQRVNAEVVQVLRAKDFLQQSTQQRGVRAVMELKQERNGCPASLCTVAIEKRLWWILSGQYGL
jgi:hypothetical protein